MVGLPLSDLHHHERAAQVDGSDGAAVVALIEEGDNLFAGHEPDEPRAVHDIPRHRRDRAA